MSQKDRKCVILAAEPGTTTGTMTPMGKTLDWVREEPSGRLIYRRTYPPALRPYLARPGQRELKVPLGARRIMTDAAWLAYSAAKRRFDTDVRRARAALELEQKQASGQVDRLSPAMIAHLVGAWREDQLSLDDEVRWLPRSRDRKLQARANLRQEVEEELAEAADLKGLGDVETIGERWADAAVSHAADLGVHVDPQAPDFLNYLIAFHDAQIEAWEIILRRLSGEPVTTPAAPPRPIQALPVSPKRTVADLMDAYKAAKWDGWSMSSRTAVTPVFRLLNDTLAHREVRGVTREDARKLMDLLRRLPAGMGRKAALQGLTVSAAIEKAEQLGFPAIAPGTINTGYLAHLSALFAWAEAEEWTERNPFKGLLVHDPVAEQDKRDAFGLDQLRALFSAPPWHVPFNAAAAKPGRYWAPLIALYSGMRLGEVCGLRLMDVEDREGVPAFNLRPYEGRTLKNRESRREVPIHSALVSLGLLSYVDRRRKEGQSTDLLFPDGKPNVRGQWGAKLSEWFAGLLRQRGITGTKLGFHSFRHSFEDRQRSAGLHGTPLGLRLTGRKAPGSATGYGDGFTLADRRDALERITYPALDLRHLIGASS